MQFQIGSGPIHVEDYFCKIALNKASASNARASSEQLSAFIGQTLLTRFIKKISRQGVTKFKETYRKEKTDTEKSGYYLLRKLCDSS